MRSFKMIFLSICIFINIKCAADTHKTNFKEYTQNISRLQSAIQSEKITCQDIVDAYINRIKKYNFATNRGAPINAFVTIATDAMQQAKKLDDFYHKNKQIMGPLHCVPIVIKDNISTADMPTTFGSLAFADFQPPKDAFVVAKLRSAGGIILGKTTLDEFTAGMSGISTIAGRTGNAFNPNENPGGSSSGTAVAISANLAMIGFGSDNTGSIRVPAVFNGIYGLRPSIGLISLTGSYPAGELNGVIGPMARNIEDLTKTLSVVAATADPEDLKTKDVPRQKSYTNQLDTKFLTDRRIGVVRSVSGKASFPDLQSASSKIFDRALTKLKNQGVTLVDVNLPKFDSSWTYNMAGEVTRVNHFLRENKSKYQNIMGICRSGLTRNYGDNLDECQKHINKAYPLNGKEYQAVKARQVKNRRYLTKIMQENKLDAFIIPINQNGAASYNILKINSTFQPLSSNSGMPSITIIAGYSDDKTPMPVGMELIGKMFAEQTLLNLAYAYSKNTPPLHIPKLGKPIGYDFWLEMPIIKINSIIQKMGSKTYFHFLKNNDADKLTARGFTAIFSGVVQNQRIKMRLP